VAVPKRMSAPESKRARRCSLLMFARVVQIFLKSRASSYLHLTPSSQNYDRVRREGAHRASALRLFPVSSSLIPLAPWRQSLLPCALFSFTPTMASLRVSAWLRSPFRVLAQVKSSFASLHLP